MDYILGVVFNKFFHVTNAAVTDLDGVLVKYTVQFVLFIFIYLYLYLHLYLWSLPCMLVLLVLVEKIIRNIK